MPIKRLLTLIILGCGFFGFGQTEEDYFGTWAILYGQNRISEKISIPTEGILRHYEFLQHYEFSFIRVGLSYRLAPNLSGTIGYAFLDSEPFVIDPEVENARQHWAYEQLNIASRIGKAKLSQRFRLENRWILKDEGTDLNHRVRYRLRAQYPIGQKLYFDFFDEVFVGLQNSFFNQNRLNVGLGYVFTPFIKLEVGYLKIHFSSTQGDSVRFALSFKTDFRKKKTTGIVSR